MKGSPLRGLLLLSVLALAAAFPSPAEHQGGRDGEPELSKKKLTKRQDGGMPFDPTDFGRYTLLSRPELSKKKLTKRQDQDMPFYPEDDFKYTLLSRLWLPGMEDASEENGTLRNCLGCCGMNATQDQLPQGSMEEGGQGGVTAYNMNMLPGLKINMTDSLGRDYNATIGRCVGCCNNGTMNATKETHEMRKERGTEDPHIQTVRIT